MTKQNQIIFMDGKEKALTQIFSGGESSIFGYLAVGYVNEQQSNTTNGFEEPTNTTTNGFNELALGDNGYQRIELIKKDTADKDPDTGKVLVRFTATLDADNITKSQPINQLAVVDDIENVNPNFYSATTFPTFIKSQDSSITFVVGFRL